METGLSVEYFFLFYHDLRYWFLSPEYLSSLNIILLMYKYILCLNSSFFFNHPVKVASTLLPSPDEQDKQDVLLQMDAN